MGAIKKIDTRIGYANSVLRELRGHRTGAFKQRSFHSLNRRQASGFL